MQIGGSLAKVVFFTRSADPPASPNLQISATASSSSEDLAVPQITDGGSPNPRLNGALTPLSLDNHSDTVPLGTAAFRNDLVQRARMRHFPGGSLNFERFETDDMEVCINFLRGLIERSAELNGVTLEEMRQSVKIVATGGGAHRCYDLLRNELGVEVHREDEMECLITGLGFITHIPQEAYWFSDELVHEIASGRQSITVKPDELERPSANPPKFAVSFEETPTTQLPCLLVNIGSGVSIIKVDADGSFERVSGTSLGGGTLWGLLSLLTPATSFDGNSFSTLSAMLAHSHLAEMLALSERGKNENVDMLVGDIYGQDYSKLGLKSTTIASSFGKVFKKGEAKREFSPEDISKSLLYALSNNIGQIASVFSQINQRKA